MDNNLNIKKNYAAVVAVSFVGAVCGCGLLLIVQNFIKIEGINLETFIGAGIGLIGICATFLVGLQIWNHIEFRVIQNRVYEIDKMEKKLQVTINNIETKFQSALCDIEKSRNLSKKQIGDVYTALYKYATNASHKSIYIALAITYGRWPIEGDVEKNKIYSQKMLRQYNQLRSVSDRCKIIVIGSFYSDFKNVITPKEYPDWVNIEEVRIYILREIELELLKSPESRSKKIIYVD